MKIPARFLRLLVIVGFAGLTACQTNGSKRFESIHLGMEKSAVVEAIGSPNINRRWSGKDRWIYEYRDRSDTVVIREVHFENGKSVYFGAPIPPTVTAAEQDKINEAEIQKQDDADRAENQRRDHQLGIERVHARDESPNAEDALDQKFRESYYGIEPDPKAQRNTLAPVFTPVR